jgi:hypothetical protein
MMSAYATPINGPADQRRSTRASAGPSAANVRDHGHLAITVLRRVRTQSILRDPD